MNIILLRVYHDKYFKHNRIKSNSVMANTYYNCGPAALATVLQKYFNITVSQDQLATLAGTDETGTTMYGLVQAAQDEGLTVEGLELPVDQLEPGNIVYLTINGVGHYSVITNITNTIVYLADSDFGNINMTLADFTAEYNGYALVITNGTPLSNGTILTTGEMQNIKGEGCACDLPDVPANTQNIMNNTFLFSTNPYSNYYPYPHYYKNYSGIPDSAVEIGKEMGSHEAQTMIDMDLDAFEENPSVDEGEAIGFWVFIVFVLH